MSHPASWGWTLADLPAVKQVFAAEGASLATGLHTWCRLKVWDMRSWRPKMHRWSTYVISNAASWRQPRSGSATSLVKDPTHFVSRQKLALELPQLLAHSRAAFLSMVIANEASGSLMGKLATHRTNSWSTKVLINLPRTWDAVHSMHYDQVQSLPQIQYFATWRITAEQYKTYGETIVDIKLCNETLHNGVLYSCRSVHIFSLPLYLICFESSACGIPAASACGIPADLCTSCSFRCTCPLSVWTSLPVIFTKWSMKCRTTVKLIKFSQYTEMCKKMLIFMT